jgi:hypothetical protein
MLFYADKRQQAANFPLKFGLPKLKPPSVHGEQMGAFFDLNGSAFPNH